MAHRACFAQLSCLPCVAQHATRVVVPGSCGSANLVRVCVCDRSAIRISDAAAEAMSDYYRDLRKAEPSREDSLPITVRTLETIIRLSIAVGKSRLAAGHPFPHLCV